jgi:hypothetical protein
MKSLNLQVTTFCEFSQRISTLWMKRKKTTTLFTAQEFQHSESGSDFQRIQIWNDR